jgi:hypothetical protein
MPRVEGQYDGAFVDRKAIADIIERHFGPQDEADIFADMLVDPETGKVGIEPLITRLYQQWKRARSS